MKTLVLHENRTRMRLHLCQNHMTCREADQVQLYLSQVAGVKQVKVHPETCNVIVEHENVREAVLASLEAFSYATCGVDEELLAHSSRALNKEYKEKLMNKVVVHYGKKWFLPTGVRTALVVCQSVPYLKAGLKCLWERKLEVPVLDATAIAASILTGSPDTAGSVMFLLGVGDLLEDWTHKKSTMDLARTMSLNVSKVWKVLEDGTELLVPLTDIQNGDIVSVHTGNVIPFDGEVTSGDGSVNQASMTGESLPVHKEAGATVYAGTALEEGELQVLVKSAGGDSRYEKIIKMIEDSESLKASIESNAEHLADRLVPYALGATALTYLVTRNVTRAMSVLMVDFSCALKLSTPITVLSAMNEGSKRGITIKGGKFMESIAVADTIVFDKTGTLTQAQPKVREVVSFNGMDPNELLRMAACMEEHFPHSIANAVVKAAADKGLVHHDLHSKVEYIVAHGIASTINGKRAIIGSRHFVFEDEHCRPPKGKEQLWQSLPNDCSHLYFAMEGELVATILIEDPLRPEAASVVASLKELGFSKVVMMTGDSERTAKSIAEAVGVDEYFAEVLPEDKASFVEQEKAAGRTVVMIGDGINDSPALSAADVGVAISTGAEIAKEVADVTINTADLHALLTMKELSNALFHRINSNYRFIAGFNSGLIGLGMFGVLQPTQTALFHNGSTIAITLAGMRPLLKD